MPCPDPTRQGGTANVTTNVGEGDAGMDRCENRTEPAASNHAEDRSIPETTSESTLWRDYLTSVLSIPIIRQETDHEIQTAA
jgi:hypothetical protein